MTQAESAAAAATENAKRWQSEFQAEKAKLAEKAEALERAEASVMLLEEEVAKAKRMNAQLSGDAGGAADLFQEELESLGKKIVELEEDSMAKDARIDELMQKCKEQESKLVESQAEAKSAQEAAESAAEQMERKQQELTESQEARVKDQQKLKDE